MKFLFFFQVTAVDNDPGRNGEITYSIRSSVHSSKFRINETTGELFTASPIDRETLIGTTTIPVNVVARDGGGKEELCPLLVTINDVNDNAPIFTSPAGYSFNVLNDLDVGSTAATIQATDKDIGRNAEIVYSLVSNPGDYFMIDINSQRTGDIKVKNTLPNNQVLCFCCVFFFFFFFFLS